MTVGTLIKKLSALPKNMKVVVDTGRDYRDYSTASELILGKYSSGFGGGDFEEDDEEPNAVMIS